MQVVLNWEKGISEYQSDFSNIQMQIMWMHKASQMGDIQEICSGGGKWLPYPRTTLPLCQMSEDIFVFAVILFK